MPKNIRCSYQVDKKEKFEKKMSSDCQNKQNKPTSFVTMPCGTSSCDDSEGIAFLARPIIECMSESEESFCDEMSQQGKLEHLKQRLRSKIQRTQIQDETIQELECQLRKVKRDLSCLKEKFDGKSRHLHGLAKYETKLKNFRGILLCSTYHLEKALRNISNCQSCNRCTCRQVIEDEGNAIECIKRDLESLQLKNYTLESHPMPQSIANTSDIKREPNMREYKPLNVNDVDNFRIQAVTGAAALEEMKEQIDILHGLIKKYYLQLPCDYEKGQVEECENKFNKLHAEFEGITDSLSDLIESFRFARSDGSDSGCFTKTTVSDVTHNSHLPEKMTRLQEDRKRLQKEIDEQRTQLEIIKNKITEVDKELSEKRYQSAEQDKEIKSRDQEISRLREGVKGFRETLRDMEIDIACNLDDKTKLVPSTESCSNLSILSNELLELYEILTTSQTSFPGIIERCKEENQKMRKELNCLETCLRNKDEALALLQKSLKMREGQAENLNSKIQSMDEELEKLRKETEEKTNMICNLKDSMNKAKEFEMKIKDENIEELQFEICELDFKLKSMVKEVLKKGKDLEVLQDEILYVSSKNFFMTREMDVLELKLGKLQKNLVIYEKMVCNLQGELRDRECESEQLYKKVKELEQELECELKKCELRTQEDSECIKELTITIRNLRNELHYMKSKTRKASPIRSKDNKCPREEPEDSYQKIDLKSVICQLKGETKTLKVPLKENEKRNEINSKIADLENIVRQGDCRQQVYNTKINELQQMLKETVSNHECEKKKLMQKLCKEKKENDKNKVLISRLNESLRCKTVFEDKLKETIRCFTLDLEFMKNENNSPRAERERIRKKDGKDNLGKKEMDKLINDLEAQKSDLKVKCRELKFELDKEEKVKKCLEEKIKSLNDTLANKTLQLNELSQCHKCTSAKAQETLTKLQEAEGRLKCMKMEMNTKRASDEYDEENEDSEGQLTENRCLEDSLEAKTAECSDLMNEVECLQTKLKAMQGEFISVQANKDCELTRLNKEITRLESELCLLHEENCKLKSDFENVQDQLKNKSKADDSFKDELEKKEKELSEVRCEKNALLKSMEDLQKRLEEICLDNTKKERENRELRDESTRLKKELSDVGNELCETRQDLEALRNEYAEAKEKLKWTERKLQNFQELYCRIDQENARLQESKSIMERDLCAAKNENFMLKEKMLCSKKQKDAETKKLMAENSNAAQENMRYCNKLQKLSCKLQNLEENFIPQLEDEIMRKERCIENYKAELEDANASSQRMREESLKVIQCTKKYLAAQRYANDSHRMRTECPKDNRHYSNDTRELEEQLKRVTHLNEHLYFYLQNEKNDYQDIEPRSFSPLPWGCSSVERDNSSPEYLAESGFQSMQQSPTNMNCMSEYCPDLKRAQSQWNNSVGRNVESTDYSPCRNSIAR